MMTGGPSALQPEKRRKPDYVRIYVRRLLDIFTAIKYNKMTLGKRRGKSPLLLWVKAG